MFFADFNEEFTINKLWILFKTKNAVLVNIPWNFHKDRLMIQGRSMYLMLFDSFAYFIQMVVLLLR